jgi:hypothetical protein
MEQTDRCEHAAEGNRQTDRQTDASMTCKGTDRQTEGQRDEHRGPVVDGRLWASESEQIVGWLTAGFIAIGHLFAHNRGQ